MRSNMNIARIDQTGTVVNIEVADTEWVEANEGVDGFTFVESTDTNVAWIGATYDPDTGLFSLMPVIVLEETPSVEADA